MNDGNQTKNNFLGTLLTRALLAVWIFHGILGGGGVNLAPF